MEQGMKQGLKESQNVPVLKINGIKDIYYEKMDDFDRSIHSSEYRNACIITTDIIKAAKPDGEKNKRRTSDWGTNTRNREQICNIVFFTGEKGSGKTSTMLSYMEFLKDYHRNIKEENEFITLLHEELEQFMFTGIDYIDASSLDEKEDILGSVLAKMLSKWKMEEQRGRYQDSGIIKADDYEYKKRQMYLQCEQLYERLKELRDTKHVLESDMFIESIESLSFSWNVKNAFQKFVESYLEVMEYPDSQGKITIENHYLVITIDDIDMNVQSGFMLMEQIRKYLMVPNVLVLMSANYEQLEKICYHHYWREFDKLDNKSPENVQYLLRISRQYLEKMVPVQRQVELQSEKRWEYFSEKKFLIQYNCRNEKMNSVLKEKGTLREIVARCMYSCFGVNFDLDENYIDYLAPDTVRDIIRWIYQIGALQNCFADNQCSDVQAYEKNWNWFMANEYPGLCKKYLSTETCGRIKTLELLEPSDQIELVKDSFKNIGAKNVSSSFLKMFVDAKTGDKDRQDFGALCLIYFNMRLQQLTVQMKYGADADEKGIAASRLLKYYSSGEWGLWGAWEKDMLAPLLRKCDSDSTGSKRQGWCRIARSQFKGKKDCLELELPGGMFAARPVRKSPARNKEEQKGVRGYIENNKEQLRNYQYLLLFYKLKDVDEEPAIWEYFNGSKLSLIKPRDGKFSLSGFVLNLFEESSLLRKFKDLLLKTFYDFKIFDAEESRKLQKEIFIDTTEELLLPIQNVDFILHIGNEIYKKLGTAERETMSLETVKERVRQYFGQIVKCLDKFDKAYADRFRNYELVKKILDQDEAFGSMLANAIMDHTEPDILPLLDDTEWAEEEVNG